MAEGSRRYLQKDVMGKDIILNRRTKQCSGLVLFSWL